MIGFASAPASSANLGPGFDCIALALSLRCRVTATSTQAWEIVSGGKPAETEAADFLRRAAEKAAGARPLRIEVDSEVPRASGLGSSAAVAAATAAAAARAGEIELDRERVFDIVSELDGHCDNAAATVYGGLVAVVDHQVVRLELSELLIPIAALPATRLLTEEARRALPETISHAAAARNVARAVALAEGLRTGNPDTLAKAAGDELHEAYRARLSPETGDLMAAALSAGAAHAAWSGAGPTVLALATAAERENVVSALEATGATVMVLEPDTEGLR